MSQTDHRPAAIEAGTLMQKPIPPRMVEPYLTGRRTVISGFAHRAAETPATSPAELFRAFGLGYEGSDFSPDMGEVYVLRWRTAPSHSYQVPYSAEHGGDWALGPPFTGTGRAGAPGQPAEFFTEPVALPVGAEIHCVRPGSEHFVASFDGQAWLRPARGPQL